MSSTIVIWDLEKVPSELEGNVILWQKFSTSTDVISVPEYLEKNSESLRKKYVSFIYELANKKIGNKTIINHLAYDDNFSFWWMTHVAEKSPFKSTEIYNCLCLLALEEILQGKKFDQISLVSPNVRLAKALGKYCSKIDVSFKFQKKNKKNENSLLRNIYNILPYPVRGLVSFRHLVYRWTLKKTKQTQWFSDPDSIFFCTYFYNLDEEAGDNGVFYSRQWEKLPEFFQANGKRNNWLHLFLTTPGSPDKKTGVEWFGEFNSHSDKQGVHSFLESYLSFSLILKVFKQWLLLNIVNWHLGSVKNYFTCSNSNMSLWPFLENDWKTSITGPISVSNCLWIELFDEAMKNIPHQKNGLYLWENQGWECALLYTWRKHEHGNIIGVQHATVRFWGLNNFDDPRCFLPERKMSKPIPDKLAVNGTAAWDEFINMGYPLNNLEKVEAARFQYLLNYKDNDIEQKKNTRCKRILVLGDFSLVNTNKMLECLELGSETSILDLDITLKPHPSCDINVEKYKKIKKTSKSLSLILYGFDIVLSSNSTSAALDAYLAGLSVIVFLDEKDFNYSPLRGAKGVEFVVGPEELVNAIKSIDVKSYNAQVDDYFWLDDNFKKWGGVMNIESKQQ
jgi:surface carbohydrate biosynthesis protein (TIGR04326 family)